MREPCSPRDMPTRRTARAREDRRARRDGDSLLNLKEICNAPSLARPAETDSTAECSTPMSTAAVDVTEGVSTLWCVMYTVGLKSAAALHMVELSRQRTLARVEAQLAS